MRAIVQRVAAASVSWTADGGLAHSEHIGRGVAVLVGAGPADGEASVMAVAGAVAGRASAAKATAASATRLSHPTRIPTQS